MPLKSFLAAAVFALSGASAIAEPSFWKHEWPETDFTKTTVGKWAEIRSGGPGKDGIPAIDMPDFGAVGAAKGIKDREPIIAVEIKGAKPRAYPIRYLMWHEIVNDIVNGVPIAVTFCPLCNSGMTFDRRVDGKRLRFGVSGKLRNSDMVMFDRETQSWWQQAIGTAIVGEMTGAKLKHLPTWMESWADFKTRNPDGVVMVEPAFSRRYGANPYRNYDRSERPFLYDGEMPPHGIAPLVRVIRVENRAWPMTRLQSERSVTEAGVTLDWHGGQASALDAARIAKGRDVGTIRVRNSAGQNIAHDVMFAFAFHAFWPNGEWMLAK